MSAVFRYAEFADELYQFDVLVMQGEWDGCRLWLQEMFDVDIKKSAEWVRAKACLVLPGWKSKRTAQTLLFWFSDRVDVTSVYDQGTVCHECLHGQQYALRERGLLINETTEEAHAYYATWLYRKMAPLLLEWKTGQEVADGTRSPDPAGEVPLQPAPVPDGPGT